MNDLADITHVDDPSPLSVPLSALTLPARALSLFKRLNVEYVGDLVQLDPNQLKKAWHFGKGSFISVQQALAQLGAKFGMSVGDWTHAQAVAIEKASPRHTASLLPLFDAPSSELRAALIGALASVDPSERNVLMIGRYLGWDGKGGSTLEKAGEPYDLTRERVRQLVARALKRLSRAYAPPVLAQALSLLESEAPIPRETASQLLRLRGLADCEFDPAGVLSAADAFGLTNQCELYDSGVSAFLIPVGSAPEAAQALRIARRLSSARGCVDLYQLPFEANLSGRYRGLQVLQELFDAAPDFEWLDRDAGWLWRKANISGGRNRLLNDLRKMLSVSSTVSVQEIRLGLRRDPRMEGFAPPLAILRAICARVTFATLSGDNVHRIEHAEAWCEVLGTSETIIAEVLRADGPVLYRVPFLNACLSRGMLEGTFAMYNSTSTIIWRPAEGLFALLGSEIPPGLIEEMQELRPRPQTEVLDHGWTNSGAMYVAWQLNDRRAAGDSLYVPAAMQRLLAGEWPAQTVRGGESVHVLIEKDKMSGLKLLFRRTGAEAGDVAVMWFERASRKATFAVGSRELADDAVTGFPLLTCADDDFGDDEVI